MLGKSNTALMGLKSYTRSGCEITKIIAVGKSEKGAVALELNGEGGIVGSFIFKTNEPITSMRLKETSEGTLFMVLSINGYNK